MIAAAPAIGARVPPGRAPARRPAASRLLPRVLIGVGVLLTLVFIVAPLLVIFAQAFAKGYDAYVANILHPETLHAIWLTVLVAVLTVPVNIVFGLFAAWALTRFAFRGKKLLLTLIEIPLSVSPIVAGVTYLLLYGRQGLLGEWLGAHDIELMFALPGIVLVTMFVTSPFVVRELIPLMQAQGSDREMAAATLGAGGWQIFRRITLPNIGWALLYGTVLCTARAIGEFGAVSVVSGNVRGTTNTLPLQVELLYHDYNAVGAFAAASTLTVIALVALMLKAWLEQRIARRGQA